MNAYLDLPEEERADKRFKYLAMSSVMQYVFSGLYMALVRKKEIKTFSELPKEYQNELWEISKQYLPDKSTEERHQFILIVMAILWLNNN